MKLVTRNFALLLFVAVGLFSCKDDDKAPAPDNKFTIGDNSYKIKTGIFFKDVEPNSDDNGTDYYRNSISFLTDGISFTDVDGEEIATGEGDMVDLLINNEGRELKAGTYTWQSEENEQPFDLWSASVTLNWNGAGETEYDFKSGTLVVAKSGDTFTITFEGIAVGDANHDEIPDSEVTVSGQFEGTLLEKDFDF
jgi:hypothetical protein